MSGKTAHTTTETEGKSTDSDKGFFTETDFLGQTHGVIENGFSEKESNNGEATEDINILYYTTINDEVTLNRIKDLSPQQFVEKLGLSWEKVFMRFRKKTSNDTRRLGLKDDVSNGRVKKWIRECVLYGNIQQRDILNYTTSATTGALLTGTDEKGNLVITSRRQEGAFIKAKELGLPIGSKFVWRWLGGQQEEKSYKYTDNDAIWQNKLNLEAGVFNTDELAALVEIVDGRPRAVEIIQNFTPENYTHEFTDLIRVLQQNLDGFGPVNGIVTKDLINALQAKGEVAGNQDDLLINLLARRYSRLDFSKITSQYTITPESDFDQAQDYIPNVKDAFADFQPYSISNLPPVAVSELEITMMIKNHLGNIDEGKLSYLIEKIIAKISAINKKRVFDNIKENITIASRPAEGQIFQTYVGIHEFRTAKIYKLKERVNNNTNINSSVKKELLAAFDVWNQLNDDFILAVVKHDRIPSLGNYSKQVQDRLQKLDKLISPSSEQDLTTKGSTDQIQNGELYFTYAEGLDRGAVPRPIPIFQTEQDGYKEEESQVDSSLLKQYYQFLQSSVELEQHFNTGLLGLDDDVEHEDLSKYDPGSSTHRYTNNLRNLQKDYKDLVPIRNYFVIDDTFERQYEQALIQNNLMQGVSLPMFRSYNKEGEVVLLIALNGVDFKAYSGDSLSEIVVNLENEDKIPEGELFYFDNSPGHDQSIKIVSKTDLQAEDVLGWIATITAIAAVAIMFLPTGGASSLALPYISAIGVTAAIGQSVKVMYDHEKLGVLSDDIIYRESFNILLNLLPLGNQIRGIKGMGKIKNVLLKNGFTNQKQLNRVSQFLAKGDDYSGYISTGTDTFFLGKDLIDGLEQIEKQIASGGLNKEEAKIARQKLAVGAILKGSIIGLFQAASLKGGKSNDQGSSNNSRDNKNIGQNNIEQNKLIPSHQVKNESDPNLHSAQKNNTALNTNEANTSIKNKAETVDLSETSQNSKKDKNLNGTSELKREVEVIYTKNTLKHMKKYKLPPPGKGYYYAEIGSGGNKRPIIKRLKKAGYKQKQLVENAETSQYEIVEKNFKKAPILSDKELNKQGSSAKSNNDKYWAEWNEAEEKLVHHKLVKPRKSAIFGSGVVRDGEVLDELNMRAIRFPVFTNNERHKPGTAYVSKIDAFNSIVNTPKGTWFYERGPTRLPLELIEKLKGKHFKSFDELREAIWRELGNNAKLYGLENHPVITGGDIERMKNGRPPKAPEEFQKEGENNKGYHLDHEHKIKDGGPVYDLNNIMIETPHDNLNN